MVVNSTRCPMSTTASPMAPDPEALRAAPQVQALISFLEHEVQPMIVLDPACNILAANTAYKRQFGTVDKPTSATSAFGSRITTTCRATRRANTAR